ncbi:MAG: hypothetical protein ACYDBX_00155 [Patescibacteria group bacterium]
MDTVEQILVRKDQDTKRSSEFPSLFELGYKPEGITREELERTQPHLVNILDLITRRVGGVPIDTEHGERKDDLFRRGSFGIYSEIRELYHKFELPIPKVSESLLQKMRESDLLVDIRRSIIIGNKGIGCSIEELIDQVNTEYPKDLEYMKIRYGETLGSRSPCFLGSVLTFSTLRLTDFHCIHYSY